MVCFNRIERTIIVKSDMGSHFPSNPSETRESTALPLGFPEQLDVLGKHRRLMEVYWAYWVCGPKRPEIIKWIGFLNCEEIVRILVAIIFMKVPILIG